MDLLLVSPPVSNVGQAAASLGVLTAYLRARGWTVDQWDAGIDAFHSFHSPASLHACARSLRDQGASRSLVEAAERAAAGITSCIAALRDARTLDDTAAMEDAFCVLEAAGVALTTVGGGRWEHGFRSFDVVGAFRDWDALDQALGDASRNPYVAWMAEHAVPHILASGARAVGVSVTYLSQLIPALTLLRALSRAAPTLPLAIGGGYLTALGDRARQIPPGLLPVQEVVLHDGEQALDRWLCRLAGRPASPPEPCIDLATVPSPSWIADGLRLDRYLVPAYAMPVPLTRGCHWGRCSYCNISAQTASRYRVRPVELALADLRHAIAETGSTWFDFPVDSFRPDHLAQLARAIVAEGLSIRWAAEVLLDKGLTTEVIRELARSGCCGLRFGLESASPEVLRAMNKPRAPDLAGRILRDCREAGIRTGAMCIVGFPSETHAQRMQTFDFLVDHREHIDFVALHEFNLVPGSPIARDPAQHGLLALPSAGVLQPAVPYRNTNQVGLEPAHVAEAAASMREALREYYPSIGKPWAVAIGGWMTFPWSATRPLPASAPARVAPNTP